ncbi:hypothetical protein [Neolewinella agarilytica]|uniref:Uncharacterized protein n=1 Tax=Neolewinella agarilytica TaxID=478744 RepID=A0A1H9L199_9BACT|nr:hypothetical protein [Neolewinella agarilytica]SER05039.1 hypothetical protein SAMN05444359_12275 [Neolewinella agarilytica]
MKFYLFLLPLVLLNACAGNNFDESSFPPDQISAEMSFKRLADHGDLEPVLREGQLVDGWQFQVSSYSKVAVLNQDPVITYSLKDRSGIDYKVTSVTSPDVIKKIENGSYGFGRGRVLTVDRDLVAGEIQAELLLSDWTPRQD